MTAHLVQLAIGPVQEFIAAARRTRDLWFGSYMLSEISKAAAKAVHDHGGHLIFPSPRDEGDLEPGSLLNVANIILAEIDGHDPGMIANLAKEAAQLRWLGVAGAVLREYHGIERILRRDIWDEQIMGVVEFYSAWVPLSRQNYAEQRKRLARIMSGRKNCRDFKQAIPHPGLPKSSLDGLRETIFQEGKKEQWPPKLRRRLRVHPGEQLDIVGLVKRTAEGHRPYPSVSRIAADPWLRGLGGTVEGVAGLGRLREACQSLCNDDLLHEINTFRLHKDYQRFPFEGTAVYRSRHHEMMADVGETEDRLADLRLALTEVEGVAARLGLGIEPDPYLVVLVADGDKMGDAISKLDNPQHHGNFSKELSKFAGDAECIVRQHHGVLIYSGGDDVLAFVPVDQALKCARALYEAFEKTMNEALREIDVKRPTLSVGVAIGHFIEQLEDLLDYGRQAEKDAKQPTRDGLAIHLHKRGGAPVKIRKQWKERLDESIARYARWFRDGSVSGRIPFELHRLADVYDDWQDSATLADAVRSDAVRVIDKKRPGGHTSQMESIRNELKGVKTAADLREFACELLIARQLAVTLRQSGATEEAKS